MNTTLRQSLFCTALLLFTGVAQAQEAPGTEKVAPPPAGVDKYYWDLAKSDDRILRAMVERYVGLVKTQEWSDLSGKFKTFAHYVKHDPQLATVTLGIMRGRGADRTTDDKTVPVDKLSKQCQSRVKQIDIAQKKIKELAAKLAKEGNSTVAAAGENAGSPMIDEAGREPGAIVPEAGTANTGERAIIAEPVPDPSAAEPDPLGFAEIPLAPPPGAAPDGQPPTVER